MLNVEENLSSIFPPIKVISERRISHNMYTSSILPHKYLSSHNVSLSQFSCLLSKAPQCAWHLFRDSFNDWHVVLGYTKNLNHAKIICSFGKSLNPGSLNDQPRLQDWTKTSLWMCPPMLKWHLHLLIGEQRVRGSRSLFYFDIFQTQISNAFIIYMFLPLINYQSKLCFKETVLVLYN